jgi:hypothetical protein
MLRWRVFCGWSLPRTSGGGDGGGTGYHAVSLSSLVEWLMAATRQKSCLTRSLCVLVVLAYIQISVLLPDLTRWLVELALWEEGNCVDISSPSTCVCVCVCVCVRVCMYKCTHKFPYLKNVNDWCAERLSIDLYHTCHFQCLHRRNHYCICMPLEFSWVSGDRPSTKTWGKMRSGELHPTQVYAGSILHEA